VGEVFLRQKSEIFFATSSTGEEIIFKKWYNQHIVAKKAKTGEYFVKISKMVV